MPKTRKTSKVTICPSCKEILDHRALATHLRIKHQTGFTSKRARMEYVKKVEEEILPKMLLREYASGKKEYFDPSGYLAKIRNHSIRTGSCRKINKRHKKIANHVLAGINLRESFLAISTKQPQKVSGSFGTKKKQ